MKKYSDDPSIVSLYARLDDLLALSERGEVVATSFLTPREAMYARSYLDPYIKEGRGTLLGGYPQAERVRAVILPAYVEGMLSTDEDTPMAQKLTDADLPDLAVEVTHLVCLLSVKGSGFRNLTHRDYLGSVLGLGLERDVLGDILVLDDHTAYIICKGEICPFLLEHLTHVGSDPVKVCCLDPATPIVYQKSTQPIHDTIASPRLDCVVAALCNLSREKAQTAVRSGLVELNYEPCDRCDVSVDAPAVLSVRGIGKFAVRSFDGETRKGRIRLVAEKYV